MLKELEEIIKRNIPVTLDIGEVTEIAEDTCTVSTAKKDYFKCAINAVRKNGENYFKAVPAKGSKVIIGIIPGENGGYPFIVSSSEITELLYKVNGVNFSINEEGLKLERNGESLQKVLEDLLKEKNKMNKEVQKIATMAGAASSVPILAEILIQTELINQRLNTLLRK